MNINEIAERHNKWVEKMGWHNKASRLESLALIGSEVGEAVNECRGEEPTDEYPDELADIVLRVFDLMIEEGIDPEQVIKEKVSKNISDGKDKNKVI